MSLYTELQASLSQAQSKEINAHNTYMSHAGVIDVKTFLDSHAKVGRTQARFHIEKSGNPRKRDAGFQSLRGGFGTLNREPSRGIVERNGIGWFFFNLPTATVDQFETEVSDLIGYLTAEGLTIVSSAVGFTMADVIVSWE